MKRNSMLFVLLLILLVSCNASDTELPTQILATMTPTPSLTSVEVSFIGDGGLISDEPCLLPCFFGISINKTKLDQVIPILEKNGIYPCNQDTATTILCGNKVIVGANSSNVSVDSIGYYPEMRISLEELISKYGTPNILHVIPSGIPEVPTTGMLLFFDAWRMRIRLPDVSGMDYVLTSTSEIELVNYFDEVLYSEIRQNMFSQSWKGYGVYQTDENH